MPDRGPREERGRDRQEERGPNRFADHGSAETRVPAPELPEDVTAQQLDSEVRAELLSLARPVSEAVARHLVASGRVLDDDPDLALAHALEARRLASRIAAVREAVGLAAYHAGDWSNAIAELRAYHRMTGRQTHLAVLADCERALGRPEKAIDLFRSADRDKLDQVAAIELLIVAAGARRDLGQDDAAAAMLQIKELTADSEAEWLPRLRYAYADALLGAGRAEEAREWFSRAAQADSDAVTDAAERLLDLDGIEIAEDDEEPEDAEGLGGAEEPEGAGEAKDSEAPLGDAAPTAEPISADEGQASELATEPGPVPGMGPVDAPEPSPEAQATPESTPDVGSRQPDEGTPEGGETRYGAAPSGDR